MKLKLKLKVAHTVTSYQSVTTILDSKLRALGQFADLEMWIISSPPSGSEKDEAAARFIALPMARTIKPLMDIKSIWQMYKVFKIRKFDVVHSHTAKAGLITAVAAWFARVPIRCHTYHGLPFYDGQNKRFYRLYRFLEKAACLFRHHVFTQNKHDLPKCIDLMGTKNRASLEGNGVDAKYLQKKAGEQSDLAKKDFIGDGLKLLLVSRLEPVKRVNDFFNTVKQLKDIGIKISAVVAGDGYLKTNLGEVLKAMDLDDCVRMLGFSNHTYGLIAVSDIVVLCSEKEGVPRALMEAMALSKPVVATDVQGTQELVVNNRTGYLVPLGDVEQMVIKIRKLANGPELCKALGRAGCRRVLEHFDDNKIAEMLHDFYIDHFKRKTNLCNI